MTSFARTGAFMVAAVLTAACGGSGQTGGGSGGSGGGGSGGSGGGGGGGGAGGLGGQGGGSGGGGGGGGEGGDPALQYYPLKVGATWVYEDIDLATGTVTDTITKSVVRTEIFDGNLTYVWHTEQTNPAEPEKEGNVWVSGGRIARVRQQNFDAGGGVSSERTYEGGCLSDCPCPGGFVRFDAALTQSDGELRECHRRHETDFLLGIDWYVDQEYVWHVESLAEEVTVGAGTFTCIKVRRTENDANPTAADQKVLWFAPGVGKVKELGVTESEELKEYSIPE